MKFSVKLGQRESNVDLQSIPTDEMLARIGAQLGAVEDVISYGPRYEGIVVVRVVSCEKHPNADKLSVCLVDDGGAVKGVERNSDGHVQVVCGAPNVRATLAVAWIPPGVVVPSTVDKDPFTLEVREIRGIKSNGMLASPSELGISDNHEGILEIDATDVGEELVTPGTPFKSLYDLDDVVIDLENKMFTHRPDCFGNLGVARELAAINGLAFVSPDWYAQPSSTQPSNGTLAFTAKNEAPESVSRFTAQVVENVQVQKSTVWMQACLQRVGIKSINNIVDWTNYYMHLTAQPTHAFDYDKIKALSGDTPTIFPRKAHKGEALALLNGKTIELTEDDIVIATDKQAVALAGVMGGSETEVDENTKNIIVECATFDMYAVRRTSMRHGLFTDAVTRFTKGQSPLQNEVVLRKLVSDIVEQTGATAGVCFDTGAPHDAPNAVHVTEQFINERLGCALSGNEIATYLQNAEFTVSIGDQLIVQPPFWRTDIELPEDIVEEVGRLHGFDKLPVTLPVRPSKPTPRNTLLDFKQSIRETLAAAGASEVLSYSFVHGDLMKKTGTDPEKWAIHLRNAISPDLQYYRTSLLPSLLDKVHMNIRSDMVRSDDNEFVLFEIGRAHVKGHETDGLPNQFERVALVVAADDKTAKRNHHGSPYYVAKRYVQTLLRGQATFEANDNNDYPITSPYQVGRSAVIKINDQIFGIVGELRPDVKKALKLPEYCAGFELDLQLALQLLSPASYVPLSTQPKTQQDITFEVSSEVTYQAVYDIVWRELMRAEAERGYFPTLGPRDIFVDEQDTSKKRLTYRLWLSHPERTLKTDEVNALLDEIAVKVRDICGGARI